MGDKKKDKSKKAAKSEVKSGKAEAAATETVETKPKKVDKEKQARREQLEANNAQVSKAVGVAAPKPELRDTGVKTSGLPEKVLKHRIETKSTVSDGSVFIDLDAVTGTSTTIYVNDIHDAAPVILEQVYWVRMREERWCMGRIEKADYDFILQHSKGRLPDQSHIVAVVDCAIYPTLSYGWNMTELKGLDFPTLDMINTKDIDFKSNPTYIHNRNPKFLVKENMPPEPKPTKPAEDDDFIMDDEEQDINVPEESADEEEFEFAD